MSEWARHCYFCPCGERVGWRTDPVSDPRIERVLIKHPYDTAFTETLRARPFSCKCGRDYDGAGTWKHEDDLPSVQYAPAFMGSLKPEITPHYNPSIGQFVESRKHLEHLQQKYDLVDCSLERNPDRVRERAHANISATREADRALERHLAHMPPPPDGDDAFLDEGETHIDPDGDAS